MVVMTFSCWSAEQQRLLKLLCLGVCWQKIDYPRVLQTIVVNSCGFRNKFSWLNMNNWLKAFRHKFSPNTLIIFVLDFYLTSLGAVCESTGSLDAAFHVSGSMLLLGGLLCCLLHLHYFQVRSFSAPPPPGLTGDDFADLDNIEDDYDDVDDLPLKQVTPSPPEVTSCAAGDNMAPRDTVVTMAADDGKPVNSVWKR